MAPNLDERIKAGIELYENGKFDECASEMRDILEDTHLARHQRIVCLLLLADTHDNWFDTERDRVEAEDRWATYRRICPPGHNEKVDTALNMLREELDRLKAAQDKENPLENKEANYFSEIRREWDDEDHVEGELGGNVDQDQSDLERDPELARGQSETGAEPTEG